MEVLYLLLLFVCAWQDKKQRQISWWLLLLFFLSGVAAFWLRRGLSAMFLLDLLPGLLLFALSLLTQGAVGQGDAVVLAAAGLFLGGSAALFELFWGLMLAAGWGCFQVWKKKISRKSRLAFLPFFWLSALGFFCLELWPI